MCLFHKRDIYNYYLALKPLYEKNIDLNDRNNIDSTSSSAQIIVYLERIVQYALSLIPNIQPIDAKGIDICKSILLYNNI